MPRTRVGAALKENLSVSIPAPLAASPLSAGRVLRLEEFRSPGQEAGGRSGSAKKKAISAAAFSRESEP